MAFASAGSGVPYVSGGGYTTPTIGTSLPGPGPLPGFSDTPTVGSGNGTEVDRPTGVDGLGPTDGGYTGSGITDVGSGASSGNGGKKQNTATLPGATDPVSGTTGGNTTRSTWSDIVDTVTGGGNKEGGVGTASPSGGGGAKSTTTGEDLFSSTLDLIKSQLTTGDALPNQKQAGAPVAVVNTGGSSGSNTGLILLGVLALGVGVWYFFFRKKSGGAE